MTSAQKFWQGVFLMLPLVLVPIVFFSALPWLTTISQPVALLVAASAAIFAMSYANYLGFRALSRLDEVQKAGAAFAAQWGPPVGQTAFALLLILPPFQNFATAIVRFFAHKFAGDSGMTMDLTVVVISLALGFSVLLVLQGIGTVIVHAVWWMVKR